MTSEIDSTTVQAVEKTLDGIEENARLCRLLARLKETGEAALTFSESAPGLRIDQSYQDAFRDYFGQAPDDNPSPDATSAVMAIRATGHEESIARALDDWALVSPTTLPAR